MRFGLFGFFLLLTLAGCAGSKSRCYKPIIATAEEGHMLVAVPCQGTQTGALVPFAATRGDSEVRTANKLAFSGT